MRAEVVCQEALAISDHEAGQSRMALFVPPSEGRGVQVIMAPADQRALTPIPVEQLTFQPPAAQARKGGWSQAVTGMPCKPIGEDTAYYQQKAVERSTLAEKRIRVAKVAAEAAHKDLLKMTLGLDLCHKILFATFLDEQEQPVQIVCDPEDVDY
jgi:hypothetical protein